MSDLFGKHIIGFLTRRLIYMWLMLQLDCYLDKEELFVIHLAPHACCNIFVIFCSVVWTCQGFKIEPSHVAYAKTKTQISCAVTAQLISAFVFDTDSTISHLLISKVSSLQLYSVTVQPDLCQTWSETQIVGFLMHMLKI